MSVYRPAGVIALAIILMNIAFLSILGGILIFTSVLPPLFEHQASLTYSLATFFIFPISVLFYGLGPLVVAATVGGLYETPSLIFVYSLVAWIILIFGVLSILTSIGLICMKSWGRYLGLVLGISAIIMSVAFFGVMFLGLLIGIPFTLIFLIFGIITVVYLAGDVKHEFQ